MNHLKQACTIGEKKSFEGERSLIEERSSSDAHRVTSNLDSAQNEESTPKVKKIIPQDLDGPKDGEKTISCPASANTEEVTMREPDKVQNFGMDIPESKTAAYSSAVMQESQGNEFQAEDLEHKMPDCTKGGLSSQTSLDLEHSTSAKNAEGIGKGDDDNVVSNKPCSTGEEKTTTQVVYGRPTKISKTRLLLRRKILEKRLPTRSSLRNCKRMFEIKPSKTADNKKVSYKKHFCLYCKLAFTQIAKHFEKKHAEETDVAHAIHFPKGSKVRQSLLEQIRDKGNYEHNCKVLKNRDGEIVIKKQVKNPKISVRDFLPCKHCFAFYRKTDLWRHERSCKVRKGDQKSTEKTKSSGDHRAASGLLPMSDFLTESCEEIIRIMHQDDVSKHIRNDPLICKYGNALSAKYDHDKSQFAYIAQKMRELGRFVVAVNELDASVKYLHEVCLPSKFELAVEGAKKLSGFDPSSSRFKTVSLITKIGYSLKRAAEIAFGESRMTEDCETESEVKMFIQLMDTKWSQCFSRKALALALKQEVKKVEVDKSSVTEDLMRLHRFITGEEDEARRELKESPNLSTWKKLGEATLADVCLFNRGRVGNIGRMLLQTYTLKKSKGPFVPSADHIRKSTKLEMELGTNFTRLELEGQYGRNMLVLLTERMVLSVDLLIENREQAGVSKTNPYLFARTEGPSFIRGLDCFRRAAMECGVTNPEALLSSSLREQIASCWQLMSLREEELDQVAKLVGLSSQDCYKFSENASKLEEVSQQLLKLDRPLPSSPPSTATDGTVQKSTLKRRPWSEKEQAAVKRFLCEFITTMKVPGKKECNACIAAEPDLCGRSWTDVKNYVHNTLQTVRRRSNQQQSEENINESSKDPVKMAKKDLEDGNIVCDMTAGHQDHLTGNSNCCMTVALPIDLRESSAPFTHEMTSSYASLCSTSSDMVHTRQPLISSFTPLNATDTQVVPTFTPHNTTNALMPPAYASENSMMMTMSPLYTQHDTNMPPPSVYGPQDTTSPPMIPSFSTFNAPSTSMMSTFTQLGSPSSPLVPTYSTLNSRSGSILSSFTSLNHLNTTSYPISPPMTPTTAQVVPTIHRPSVPDRTQVIQRSAPASAAASPAVKPQKRIKRLWSEEEQAAVKRQFGDFCKLVKVPGKKDCDACLAAEPALNSRTWREVKYFVHNSIQSLKRKGQPVASKQSADQEPETQNSNTEWDGPVYLSL